MQLTLSVNNLILVSLCHIYSSLQLAKKHPDSGHRFLDHTNACPAQGSNPRHVAPSYFGLVTFNLGWRCSQSTKST